MSPFMPRPGMSGRKPRRSRDAKELYTLSGTLCPSSPAANGQVPPEWRLRYSITSSPAITPQPQARIVASGCALWLPP